MHEKKPGYMKLLLRESTIVHVHWELSVAKTLQRISPIKLLQVVSEKSWNINNLEAGDLGNRFHDMAYNWTSCLMLFVTELFQKSYSANITIGMPQ